MSRAPAEGVEFKRRGLLPEEALRAKRVGVGEDVLVEADQRAARADIDQAKRIWRNGDVLILSGFIAYDMDQKDFAYTEFAEGLIAFLRGPPGAPCTRRVRSRLRSTGVRSRSAG